MRRNLFDVWSVGAARRGAFPGFSKQLIILKHTSLFYKIIIIIDKHFSTELFGITHVWVAAAARCEGWATLPRFSARTQH